MYFYLEELEKKQISADGSCVRCLALESFSSALTCTIYGSNQQIFVLLKNDPP